MPAPKPLVLLICTANCCRSQLAEGLLRSLAGDFLDVQSAGASPVGYVHPFAILVLDEIGIDISANRSKHLNEFLDQNVETVITLCDHANDACPNFPTQKNRHHFPFRDPAMAMGATEVVLEKFRQTREEMKHFFTAYAAGRKDARA